MEMLYYQIISAFQPTTNPSAKVQDVRRSPPCCLPQTCKLPPCFRVLIRASNYLTWKELWSIRPANFGPELSFLPAPREEPGSGRRLARVAFSIRAMGTLYARFNFA